MDFSDNPMYLYQQLAGKTVLVIGTGGIGRRFVWKTLQDLKLKVILVNPVEVQYAIDYVDQFVHYNYREGHYTEDEYHANNIIKLIGDRVGELSGCFTYEGFSIHLTAVVCQKLGFIGISPEAAKIVKSKKETYAALRSGNDHSDYNTAVHSPLSFRIMSEEDIRNAKGLSYPAILKPEYCHSAMGVTLVASEDDCVYHYHRLQNSDDVDWKRESYGSNMVLMEFMPGISYQVEVIMFNGDMVKGLASCLGPRFRDASPKLPPVFSDTITCFSSCLSEDLTKQLITAGFQCCKKVGLYNGVFNLEMKLTNTGFRLVEINGRVGCYRRCSVFKVTDGIDLWVIQALIACGIRPIFSEAKKRHAVGCYLYSSLHRGPLSDPKNMNQITSLCNDNKILFVKETESMVEERVYPRPHAHLVSLDDTSTTLAKEKLIKLCRDLQVTNEIYDVVKLTEFIPTEF